MNGQQGLAPGRIRNIEALLSCVAAVDENVRPAAGVSRSEGCRGYDHHLQSDQGFFSASTGSSKRLMYEPSLLDADHYSLAGITKAGWSTLTILNPRSRPTSRHAGANIPRTCRQELQIDPGGQDRRRTGVSRVLPLLDAPRRLAQRPAHTACGPSLHGDHFTAAPRHESAKKLDIDPMEMYGNQKDRSKCATVCRPGYALGLLNCDRADDAPRG